MDDYKSVADFYHSKNIFLTGATGFIGKVLIAKLLRSCPDVNAIYCLVRPKKGQSAKERLETMLQEQLYNDLKKDSLDQTEKIHAVHGDMLEEGLGLRETDKEFLKDNIDIVIHSAATVRFDEPLRLAVNMNLIGVRRIIHFCSSLSKLEVLIHVSTAYANCDRDFIEERIYPVAVHPQKIIDAVEWMNDDMVDSITPMLLGNKPNTYTFTKQLAETLLLEEGSHLPLAIVRPSIVTAAWREPVTGWIDNLNGPSGIYVSSGKGLLRSLKAEPAAIADIIPVDLIVNVMICVGWSTVCHQQQRNAKVYQLTSGTLNPFTWGQMELICNDYFKRMPFESCFRRPKCHLTASSLMHDWWVVVSHLVPAYAADLGFVMLGKKPRMVRIYNKLHKALRSLEYFTQRSWEWTHTNVEALRDRLNPSDHKIFFFDPREIDWHMYTENYVLGTKKYILKEDPSNIAAAQAHLRMLRNVRYSFNTVLIVLFWRVFIAKSSMARNTWYFILSLVFKFVRFFRITSSIRQ